MATQWPLVVARLVELLPTLNGWSDVKVYDGPPVTEATPAKYATVGYVPGATHAGSYNTTLNGDGLQYLETGQVIGQLVASGGGTDQPKVRADAFAAMDALDAYVRKDRRIGVLSQEGYTDLAVEPLPASNRQGAALALNWTLSYYTVT